jgi:hypothetical protein
MVADSVAAVHTATTSIGRGWIRLMGLTPLMLPLTCLTATRDQRILNAFDIRQGDRATAHATPPPASRRNTQQAPPRTRRRRASPALTRPPATQLTAAAEDHASTTKPEARVLPLGARKPAEGLIHG